jgi:hypothetical protein
MASSLASAAGMAKFARYDLLALEDVLDNDSDSAKVTAAQTMLKLNNMMPEQQELADEDYEDIQIRLVGWLDGTLDYIEDYNYDREFQAKRNPGYIINDSFWLSPEQQVRADSGSLIEDQNSWEWLDNYVFGDLPERHPFIEEHYEFPEWVTRPQ